MRFPWSRSDRKPISIPEDFDDDFYLAAHADVAEAVSRGDFSSGYEHFHIHGEGEHRIWSNKTGLVAFDRRARMGSGIYFPETMRDFYARRAWKPTLSGRRAYGQLLILVPHLRTELFYAGYSSFFAECAAVAEDFSDVMVVCVDDQIAPGILDSYLPEARVVGAHELGGEPLDEPDLVISFDANTTLIACDDLGLRARTIYYCQDFEAGFHPYGLAYTRALRALHVCDYLVVSTPQLREFLDARGLLTAREVCVTVPQVKKLSPRPTVPRRIFVYFRPEYFNTRNMADYLLPEILQFCDTHTGYEFFLVGTVATDLAFTYEGNSIVVLSKLNFDDYEEIVMSSEVAISMIYSAHPGVVAYQTALSGIPTITNVFDNRSAEEVRRLSPNLIPLDVERDSFVDVFERALAHPSAAQESFVFGDDGQPSSVDFMRRIGRAVANHT
jgi:hypothetical protein